MSDSTTFDAGATGFGRAALLAMKEPVVYVAASAPFWSKWLEHVSDMAAKLGPIFAILLALARIWVVLSERNDKGADRFGRVEKTGTIAGSVVATGAKLGGKWLAPILGALGAVALVAWLVTPNAAKAAPAATVARPAGRSRKRSDDDAGEDEGPLGDFKPGKDTPPPWFLSLHADIGQHERPGRKHNPVIVKYFADAGFPGVKDDETAWCAACVNAHLERHGIPGTKSLAARSFERWGEECEPRIGCVVVMSRGDPKGWQGHVGLYYGETATHVIVLGGNQGDAVSVAKFPKSRVVAYRWPRGIAKSRIARANAGAVVAGTKAAVIETVAPTPEAAQPIAEALEPVHSSLSQAAMFLPIAGKIAAALAVALSVYALWRRYQDHKERGI